MRLSVKCICACGMRVRRVSTLCACVRVCVTPEVQERLDSQEDRQEGIAEQQNNSNNFNKSTSFVKLSHKTSAQLRTRTHTDQNTLRIEHTQKIAALFRWERAGTSEQHTQLQRKSMWLTELPYCCWGGYC